jgi:glucose/arabinose dehydrogenase
MKNLYIVILSFFFTIDSLAQPGTLKMTPLGNLNLTPVKLEVPPKFRTYIDTNRVLNLPANFRAQLFYIGGLTKPRFLHFGPDGELYVADYKSNGAIYKLPDINNDYVADTLIAVATGVNAHDFRFYKGFLYVAEQTRVLKCSDENFDGFYEKKEVFADNLTAGAAQTTGGHVTRTLMFDSMNQKLYVSVGSSCNVCREYYRANILQFNIDGTGKRVYATGIRNAVGLALHPKTNRLWANNNGSDRQGNNIPPEWIDVIRPDGFYGHPFAYGYQVWFDLNTQADYIALKPITMADSLNVIKQMEPAGLIQSHSAPMGLEFLNSSHKALENGLLLASRGSWNRTPATGYKLIYLHLTNASDTTIDYAADFCTGFMTDSTNSNPVFWGRPVGLATTDNGEIFMTSDDGFKMVIRIYQMPTLGFDEKKVEKFNCYPNPFEKTLTVEFEKETLGQIDLINSIGEVVLVEVINHKMNVTLETGHLAPGVYSLRIVSGNQVSFKKAVCVRNLFDK